MSNPMDLSGRRSLITGAASRITGHLLMVDGGYPISRST
jgi:hypothetical protein